MSGPRHLLPHPSDVGRRVRQLLGPLLLVFALGCCAAGMVLALLLQSGWIGPEGLRW